MTLTLLTNKDLAGRWQLCTDKISELSKALDVPPSIDSYRCHRWTEAQAARLFAAWQRFEAKRSARRERKASKRRGQRQVGS